MKVLFISLIFIFTLSHSSSAPTEDEVTALPGLAQKSSFRQYSGYLSGGQDIYLHYWFVESQGSPTKDPLILWLNGGPGCSSLDGLIKENGPYRVGTDGKTVTPDPNSWNTLANVLYLESPVGVGFSYTTQSGTFRNSDEETAKMNYLALQDFFKKFPEYKTNDFYITGESYAGIYVPTLAVQVYRNNATFNLKGLAIGNGLLDTDLLRRSETELFLGHGLVDAKVYDGLMKQCCKCTTTGAQLCDLQDKTSCPSTAWNEVKLPTGIDIYHVFNDCNDELHYTRLEHIIRAKYGDDSDYLARFKELAVAAPKCPNMNYTGYFNTAEVRKALHIPDSVKKWELCSSVNYQRQHSNMKTEFKELIETHKVPTFIVYNGDLDMICDFLGDQRFVDSLGYKLKDSYREWKVDGRIGGFVKRYEGITYTTVRQAGHMVPTDQPEAGLAVVKELLGIKALDKA